MKKLILTFALSVATVANISAQTAKQVIDNYVTALGGKQKLESVKTLSMKNTISVMGMEMEGKTVKKDNKFKSTQSMMGQEMSQVFDGEKGFANQMGQKIDFPADQVAKLKDAKIMDALGLNPEKMKTVEKKQIDGKDYIVLSSDDSKYYFDAKTNLLWKTEGDKGTMIISKYADIDGIKFVEEMSIDAAGQQVSVKNSDIKINQPVSDEEFK
ncbi:LolA family protein [Epilithonimonas sp.]|uniref:LolA family protein n=1 Tax=Epilithonimonas sp. TaxID=2894511 RepID=UPI002FDD1921